MPAILRSGECWRTIARIFWLRCRRVPGILSFDYQALALAEINGDGLSDVVMGDVQADSGSPGIVALSLGSMAGVGAREGLNVPCNNARNRRGYAVTCGFDLNDDGFGDAAVSANDEEGV